VLHHARNRLLEIQLGNCCAIVAVGNAPKDFRSRAFGRLGKNECATPIDFLIATRILEVS
jgi:hypothetical protein